MLLCLGAEVDLHRGLGVVVGLEEFELARFEAADAGDDAAGEHLDTVEEIADVGVVETPGAGDAGFGLAEFVLQLEEVLIGLEIGIGFERRDQTAGGLAELILDLGRSAGPLFLSATAWLRRLVTSSRTPFSCWA